MTNDSLVDQAKVILRRIHGNCDVDREQTRADLELVQEELEALLASLDD